MVVVLAPAFDEDLGFEEGVEDLSVEQFVSQLTDVIPKLNTDVQRLRSYLTAKGYLSAERDPTPILSTGQRGDVDIQDCFHALTHAMKTPPALLWQTH